MNGEASRNVPEVRRAALADRRAAVGVRQFGGDGLLHVEAFAEDERLCSQNYRDEVTKSAARGVAVSNARSASYRGVAAPASNSSTIAGSMALSPAGSDVSG